MEQNENLENINPTPEEEKNAEPEYTVEELLAQLNAAKAENKRYKDAVTKASSEAATWKKQLRARQTQEEQEAEAKREAEEERSNHLKAVERELAMMKATNRYLKQGMDEKLAKECAELEADNDIDTLMEKIASHRDASISAAVKKAQEDLLASRPEINAGHGENGGKEEEDQFKKAFMNPDAY